MIMAGGLLLICLPILAAFLASGVWVFCVAAGRDDRSVPERDEGFVP